MAWGSFVTGILSTLTTAITKPIQEWQHRKTIEAEGALEVEKMRAQAVIEAAKQGQVIEADWDRNVQMQMGHTWKDELLMLIFLAPFVCSFLPQAQPYVHAGFKFLQEETPWWYQAILLGIVAATFGLRWLVAPIVNKLQK